MRNWIALIFTLITSLSLVAQPSNSILPNTNIVDSGRKNIDSGRSVKLRYKMLEANQNSSEAEHVTAVLRDADSGKMVYLTLEETGPNTGEFVGQYAVGWQQSSKLIPEIFFPPADVMANKGNKDVILQMIQNGQIKRKPFLLRRGGNDEQVLEVFDTKEQALEALNQYRKARGLNPMLLAKDAQAKAAAEALKVKQLEEERKNLELLERQRAAELIRKQQQLSAEEKERRHQQATELAALAMQHFLKNEFVEAEANFKKAVELDPENKSYYLNYGITLFRLKKYNESIAVLNVLETNESNRASKNFYLGLNYFYLKEYQAGIAPLTDVKNLKVKTLSSSASFYLGIILMELKKYEESKESFQEVLDTSEDAQLDKQAETYIEIIDKLQYYEKLRTSKFILNYTGGVQYDSNILYTADGTASSSSSSNLGGWRYLLSGGLAFRPVLYENFEASIKGSSTYMYSVDSRFAKADPLAYGVGLPIVYKRKAFDKDYKLEFTPSYDVLYLDINSTGTKINISNTVNVAANNSFVMSDEWLFALNLSYANAKSLITSGDDSSSGNTIGLATSNTFYLTKDKSKSAGADLGYTLCQAEGKNAQYNKVDVAGSYTAPLNKWELLGIYKAGYGLQTYPSISTARKDTNYSLTGTFVKPIVSWISAASVLNYTKNSSNVDTYTYSKYSIMLILTGQVSF